MKPIIALDADGVLLDYHQSYRLAWHRAFGVLPAIRDPLAYWPIDRWEVQRLAGEKLDQFRTCFDQEFWSTIPAISGAVDACIRLRDAGFDLVCVSAVEEKHKSARLQNLRDCGFPIECVVATDSANSGMSPKAAALKALRPIAFVDDFLPYLRGIPSEIHAALVLREPNGSPNVGTEQKLAHSMHEDLAGFATWWLARAPL
ncbi:MAG: HAD family hydrolase [bacterium]|uniref:HAD family hydrolase n=2 Tax=Undibacterium TaxID=401469 RepID=A0A6M4A1J1_9BURK|nr:HAD family hydrolase [Undibacterium parvum]AZP14025.1 HAD family hydrolase [Undibacterium parvum]MDO8728349.1 HAD family hydrolase [bacterium]QJQ04973.1 HAD family hydrolase [Undibacterium piscinae]